MLKYVGKGGYVMDNFKTNGKRCLICGEPAVFEKKPITGDSFFIAAHDSKENATYVDAGIAFTCTLCENCGNIQLQAIPK